MINIGIYKITNQENGKFYIGSSKHLDRRWWEHTNDLNKNQHDNIKLQHAWNYYGPNAFDFIVLENVEIDNLLEREQYYLTTFAPYKRNVGYNISDKASGGDNFTHNPNRSKILEKITNLNNSNRMHGKKHSTEAIDKQKEKAIGRYSLEWFINKYGDRVGNEKYVERNTFLKNRDIVHVYDNGLKGVKRGSTPQVIRDRISDSKREFKKNKPAFLLELKSGTYTTKQLSDKYCISTAAVKYHKRKFRF
jgi:group I intron endonuclease